ncbi:olfactory receptor 13G1-like [Tiliqua scincoides]|uniref:olfactory receptor 13G1-like n=1 Tax=Tiliqua scincoides TaxID=71010 RepID=UPI003461FEDB
MEFILLGLSTSPSLQAILFPLVTFLYITALTGNFLLVLAICTCKKLHTPMYFLLINLSAVNVFSISVTTPKWLQTLFTHRRTISFQGCVTQMFLFIWALVTELLLLSFMAFDRYAAICHPLQYRMIMRKEVCIAMGMMVWGFGLLNSVIQTAVLLPLSFCQDNLINHFFCDFPPLLKTSCSDTSMNERMAIASDTVFGLISCGFTLTSYFFIMRSIFKIRSAEGKRKAFSTCSSHLFVVTFYFSAVMYTYMRPRSSYSPDTDKWVNLLYSVATPVLNPMIYSLRNKDVKGALRTLIGAVQQCQRS